MKKGINNLNETWFSNQLAWLLDPNGSHGLKSDFAKEFLQVSLLKYPMKKEINLDGFEVCREFYIQVDKKPKRIDLVYMNLQKKQIIVIENKYKGQNSKNQLSEYMQIEDLFEGCDIYYIYARYGDNTINEKNLDENRQEMVLNQYNFLSWRSNILPILEKYASKSYEIFKLYQLLKDEGNIESDLTQEQLLNISEEILNYIDKKSLSKTSKWMKNNNDTCMETENKNQKIYVSLQDKNIEIKYGNNKTQKENIFYIQNTFSNKQIIYYLIYILEKATRFEKRNAYKEKNINLDKDDLFHQLILYKNE